MSIKGLLATEMSKIKDKIKSKTLKNINRKMSSTQSLMLSQTLTKQSMNSSFESLNKGTVANESESKEGSPKPKMV